MLKFLLTYCCQWACLANQCVALFREGNYEEAHNRFCSDEIESIEPQGAPLEYAKGREAIAGKGKGWQAMWEEMHSNEVSDPVVVSFHVP